MTGIQLLKALNSLADTIQFEHSFDSLAYTECCKIRNAIGKELQQHLLTIDPKNYSANDQQIADGKWGQLF